MVAMASMEKLVEDGGLLLLAVPVAADALVRRLYDRALAGYLHSSVLTFETIAAVSNCAAAQLDTAAARLQA